MHCTVLFLELGNLKLKPKFFGTESMSKAYAGSSLRCIKWHLFSHSGTFSMILTSLRWWPDNTCSYVLLQSWVREIPDSLLKILFWKEGCTYHYFNRNDGSKFRRGQTFTMIYLECILKCNHRIKAHSCTAGPCTLWMITANVFSGTCLIYFQRKITILY